MAKRPCEKCNGSGNRFTPGTSPELDWTCYVCQGDGVVEDPWANPMEFKDLNPDDPEVRLERALEADEARRKEPPTKSSRQSRRSRARDPMLALSQHLEVALRRFAAAERPTDFPGQHEARESAIDAMMAFMSPVSAHLRASFLAEAIVDGLKDNNWPWDKLAKAKGV